jgi:hypothetical protein
MILLATNKLLAVFLPVFAAIIGTLVAIYINERKRNKDK